MDKLLDLDKCWLRVKCNVCSWSDEDIYNPNQPGSMWKVAKRLMQRHRRLHSECTVHYCKDDFKIMTK